jgi:predicted hotdog family 3-hydroxylacyl-ACP dehydratase
VLIEREELCSLIPHDGAMCLLDAVLDWDDAHIVCLSHSHLQKDNPLRSEGRLSSLHGLEYGAQAMAVHGGLLARERGEQIQAGYLAALRQVELDVDWLDAIDGPLQVEARRLLGQGGQFIYQIRVLSQGRQLLKARATVMARKVEDGQV